MRAAEQVWISDSIEARELRSSLRASEHVLHGRRAHLFLLASGAGNLTLDDSEHTIFARNLVWLPLGHPAVVRFEAGTRGWALSAPATLLGRAALIERLQEVLANQISQPIVYREVGQQRSLRIAQLIKTIQDELGPGETGFETVTQCCLTQILIEILRLPRDDMSSAAPIPQNIVHSFMFLVDLHLAEHWKVGQYAERLGVSKDRLNRAISRATGRSPLAHIQARMMTEAKSMLARSTDSVASVGYKLGFADAAYFNRFFHRNAGLSPGGFRRMVERTALTAETAYHAWP